MTEGPSKATISAWARLARVQQQALRSIERALKEAGLPPLAWYDVLLELERAGGPGLRPFELERAMLLAQYNLSRLIDRLEAAGHVERITCEDDGRGHLIAVTASGRAMRRKMWPVYARAIEQAIGRHLAAAEVRSLDGLLGALLERQTG